MDFSDQKSATFRYMSATMEPFSLCVISAAGIFSVHRHKIFGDLCAADGVNGFGFITSIRFETLSLYLDRICR